MKMKTAMVLAAVSVLVSGCAETKSQAEIQIQGVSSQDPWYMIDGWHYEQDGIGWFTIDNSRAQDGRGVPYCLSTGL
jgi:hypothetical protein